MSTERQQTTPDLVDGPVSPGLAAAADKLEKIGKHHGWWDQNLKDWSWRTTDDSIGREEFLGIVKEIIDAHQKGGTMTEPAPQQTTRRVRHKKRGTIYEIIGTAELQMSTDLVDGSLLRIYRGEDGKWWARQEDEFEDGRFEDVAP